MSAPTDPIEITFRIPGTWSGPRELLERLPAGYSLSPEGLTLPNGQQLGFAPMQPDGQFAKIFQTSCRRPATPEEIDRVNRYTVNVGLFGPGGSIEAARTMMQAAAAIIQAGGAGVFIDNSGVAHGGETWTELTAVGGADALSFAFVSVVGGEREIWTMGMHALGFPEVRIPHSGDDSLGDLVIDVLRYICQSERPVEVGHLLLIDAGHSLQVTERTPSRFEPGTPMYNPFGCLTLLPGAEIARRN